MATFAQRLRELRDATGLSQEKLARAADLSASAVRDYESGRKEPTLRSALRLAHALGVDYRVIFEDIDSAPEEPAPKAEAPKKPKRPKRKS